MIAGYGLSAEFVCFESKCKCSGKPVSSGGRQWAPSLALNVTVSGVVLVDTGHIHLCTLYFDEFWFPTTCFHTVKTYKLTDWYRWPGGKQTGAEERRIEKVLFFFSFPLEIYSHMAWQTQACSSNLSSNYFMPSLLVSSPCRLPGNGKSNGNLVASDIHSPVSDHCMMAHSRDVVLIF